VSNARNLGNITTSGLTGDLKVDTDTLVVDSANNRVGIGSASPTTTLDITGTATATAFSGPLTGNVTGQVSDISNHSTTDLTEGTNLYYTDARVGTYISGDRTYGNITTTGYIAGPATLTIDPAGVGDNTGTVVIAGDLQVDGTTTTINSTTMTVDDLNLTLASGAANAAAANGAGLTVDGAGAELTYTSADDRWNLNRELTINTSTSGGLDILASTSDAYVQLKEANSARGWIISNDGNNNSGTNYSLGFVENNNGVIRYRMAVVPGGNVGIGTVVPEAALHVISDTTTSPAMIIRNDNASAGGRGLLIQHDNGGSGSDRYALNIITGYGIGNVQSLFVDGNGYVGIGTTAPVTPFHVYHSALNGVATFESGDAQGGIALRDNSTTQPVYLLADGDAFKVQTNTQERLRINSSGNIGIGNDPDTYSLYRATIRRDDPTAMPVTGISGEAVLGLINNDTTLFSYSNLVLRAGTGDCGIAAVYQGSSNNSDLILYTDGGGNGIERMRISNEGFVGINTNNPSVELDIKRTTNAYPVRIQSVGGEGRAMLFADVQTTPVKYNWLIGAQYNIDDGFEITPSTAVGGYTFNAGTGIILHNNGTVGIGTSNAASSGGLAIWQKSLNFMSIDGSYKSKIRFHEGGNSAYNDESFYIERDGTLAGEDNLLKIFGDGAGTGGYGGPGGITIHRNGAVYVGGDNDWQILNGLDATNSQFTIGGNHNANYNTGGKTKLLITGMDNDGGETYPLRIQDENANDTAYFFQHGSGANTDLYVSGNITGHDNVCNVVTFTSNLQTSNSTTSAVEIAAMAASITLKRAGSKILYMATCSQETDITATNANGFFILEYRVNGGAYSAVSNIITQGSMAEAGGGTGQNTVNFSFTPSGTSVGDVIDIKIVHSKNSSANITFNQQNLNAQPANTVNVARGVVMEIGN